jgi:hypothetical protein
LNEQRIVLKYSLFAMLLATSTVATAGCAADTDTPDEGAVDSSEDDLLKKTGPTSSWSYRGLMPALDAPQLTVSLKGHTVHVAGLLPASFHGQLPFYAKTETVGTRTRVHLAYPIATVDPNGHLPDGTPTRNPEPFAYSASRTSSASTAASAARP